MIDTCCLNCVYFSAYTNECSKNHLGDSVEIDNPKGAKCEDWEYSEFT